MNDFKQFVDMLKGNYKFITLLQAFNNFMLNASLTTREQTQIYYNKLWKRLFKVVSNLGLETTNDITKITYKHIELELKQLGYANNSINKFTDLLKMIIKYNFDMEYINKNEIIGMKKLPKDNTTIKIINNELKDKIITYINNLDLNTNHNLRNICIMLILSETGLRINELLHLKLENLKIEDNEILVEYTKTKIPRYVFFSDKTKELLKQYLLVRNNDNEYLFNSNGKSKLYRTCIYLFIDKIKSDLNISQSISPHKWRHTLATSLLDKNININQVKELLGHTELTTTKKYLHVDKEKTKKDLLKVL